jgi:uncharacterized protein (TIGR02118 family)
MLNLNTVTKSSIMTFKRTLPVLLLITCLVAFTSEKQKDINKKTSPAMEEKGLTKVSIMYPYAEGKTFNMAYYETKHMPMVAGFLGSNLVRYSIDKGVASGIPNTPLPYMAVGSFYVKSLADYQAAIAPNIATIRADFANYTNVAPVILVSEVVR